MKKLTLILALAVFMIAMAGQARAATSGTISVTVSLELISVSLDASAWNIGPISLGGSSVLPTVTATNDGNVSLDLVIRGAIGAGGWAIGATAASDTFVVAVTAPALTLTSSSDQTLVTGLAAAGTKNIDLTYSAPTADTVGGGVDQGFDITITASMTP